MSSEGFDHDALQDLRNKVEEDLLIIYPTNPGETAYLIIDFKKPLTSLCGDSMVELSCGTKSVAIKNG